METELLQKLEKKLITKEELFEKVKDNFSLLTEIIDGLSSPKAGVRYSCGKILMDLSEDYPDRLYPYMDIFINILDSKYRILIWNSLVIIANLTKVDKNKLFDSIFDKYYSLINNEYMVTVATVVGNSGKIALAKPNLIGKITNELLKVDNISTTPHLTEECKRVITEKAIKSFDMIFDKVEEKDKIIAFVKKHVDSSRRTLRIETEKFLREWVS